MARGWIDWEWIDIPHPLGPASDLVRLDSRWIGSVGHPDPQPLRMGYWVSDDATEWSFIEVDPSLFGMSSGSLHTFAVFGDALYAIASGRDNRVDDDMVVTSTDGGASWYPILADLTPVSLAAGPHGVVVMVHGAGPYDWVAVSSSDGDEWTSAQLTLTGVSTPTTAVTSSGFYVSGAELDAVDEITRPSIWSSVGGLNWARASLTAANPATTAITLAASSQGMLALSTDSGGSRLHLRHDSGVWEDVTPTVLSPDVRLIAPGPGQIGPVLLIDRAQRPKIWWTSDLEDWHGADLLSVGPARNVTVAGVFGDTIFLRTDNPHDPYETNWTMGHVRSLGPTVKVPKCDALISDEPWIILHTETYPGAQCLNVGMHQNVQIVNKGSETTRIKVNGGLNSIPPGDRHAIRIGKTFDPGRYLIPAGPYSMPELRVIDPTASIFATSRMTENSFGPIQLGMTLKAATDAVGQVIAVWEDLPPCRSATVRGDPYSPILTIEGSSDENGIITGITTTFPTSGTIGYSIDHCEPDH